jgi:hypothetical protein
MPPASLAGSGEKLGINLRIGQSVCCGLCQEPFFSGAVQIYRRLVKGCDIRGLPVGTWTSVGSICVMLVGFFPAGSTSIRIVATLGYE